jgi:hypothetical protein
MLMFKNRIVKNVEIDGVDFYDHPDYCDAHFCYAEWENGTPLTDEELEQLTSECGDVVNEMANECLFSAADDARDRMRDSWYE